MKIAIIGTGNVATMLSRLLKKAQYQLVMIYGRDRQKAECLAQKLDTHYCTNAAEMNKIIADLYIIAVSDQVIERLLPDFVFPETSIVVHTAASVSLDVCKNHAKNYGVLYPLQTIRKESVHIPEIPLFVDGNNLNTKNKLFSIASALTPLVAEATDTDRIRLHIAAVFVSNFTNFLYATAEKYCIANNIKFEMLQPLIYETAARLKNQAPSDVMTGPAVRADYNTIQKHEDLLKHQPQILEIYRFLTQRIIEENKGKED